jgi:septal ring factor EnvC (AmiA/AmiB activator)
MVQGELDPKQKELFKTTDRLQEMNREYEISLHAITEKEKLLNQRGENLLALQKQVRELRTTSAQKDAALRRAATTFDEVLYAMNEARFAPFPKNEHGQYVLPNKTSHGGKLLVLWNVPFTF